MAVVPHMNWLLLGAQVVITGRKIEKLEKAAARNFRRWVEKSVSSSVITVTEEQVKSMIAEVIEKFGKRDGLVNNAGGQFPSALESISANGFDAVVRNNLHSTFYLMREAYNQWMAKHGGSIVNMAADMWAVCQEWDILVQHAQVWIT